MKTSIKLRIVGFILCFAFLIYTAGCIPHIFSWLPTLVMAHFAARDRKFMAWFLKTTKNLCGVE